MTLLLLSIAAAAYGCDTAEQLAIDATGFANAHSGHGSLDLPFGSLDLPWWCRTWQAFWRGDLCLFDMLSYWKFQEYYSWLAPFLLH